MKKIAKWVAKKIVKGVALALVLLDFLKIYSFPNGLSIFRKINKAVICWSPTTRTLRPLAI